jgi:maltokinase
MNPVYQADVEALLPSWIGNQRWFSKSESAPAKARIVEDEVYGDAWPRLWWMAVEVDGSALYQVPIGLERSGELGSRLLGQEQAIIGSAEIDGEQVVVYDALADSELGCRLADVICDGSQEVSNMRPVGAEQSNTSLVFDNRLIIKFFRRLHVGANPDLEVTKKLSDADFSHVAPVVATWERGDHDLAVCQPYLRDGTDGWKLALDSVHEQLGDSESDAGADFSEEARMLGAMTGEMHVSMARNLSCDEFDPKILVRSLEKGRSTLAQPLAARLDVLIGAIRALEPGGAGKATRVHGDFHLGQTLRVANGWYVFDFEGEPARPLSERNLLTSPLKDVAGMARSFHYATAAAVNEHRVGERQSLYEPARSWEHNSGAAFIEGYLQVDGIDSILPKNDEVLNLLVRGFEVEKAIYELAYEKAYRPDWVAIPTEALQRLLEG